MVKLGWKEEINCFRKFNLSFDTKKNTLTKNFAVTLFSALDNPTTIFCANLSQSISYAVGNLLENLRH